MIKNNTKKVIYITNMEFFMFVSDKNLRCSFYYIERNPTFMKNNLKKDTWKELRLHVRLQTFGKKCIEEGGSEININDQELIVSKKCPKGSRGSKKLQTGEVYTMSLYFTKDEPSNYFGWSKVYGKNWISDFKDTSSITFL